MLHKKNLKNMLRLFGFALTLGAFAVSCKIEDEEETKADPKKSAISLEADKWMNGELRETKNKDGSTNDGVQWFKFEANASTQYVFVKFGTRDYVYVSLYASNFEPVGTEQKWSGNTGTVASSSWPVTESATYYLKVTCSREGTYKIGFSDFPAQPGTRPTAEDELTLDKWNDGKIISYKNGGNEYEWFKFDATDSTQYVYVKFSTLTNLSAYLYDSDLNLIGTDVHMYGSSGEVKNFSRPVNEGKTYYVKITKGDYAYNTSDTGSYWIGFTDFPCRPEKNIIDLENNWRNGKIDSDTVGDSYEWFKFDATDSTQYIYVKFSTLTNLNAYLYDSDLNLIGTGVHLNGSAGEVKSFSRPVNEGKTYYVKITKGDYAYKTSDTGSYWIAFTSTEEEPSN